MRRYTDIYKDTGCKFHAFCLECPEPVCIEELSPWVRRAKKAAWYKEQRRESTPRYREQQRAYAARYRERNREKLALKAREYHQTVVKPRRQAVAAQT